MDWFFEKAFPLIFVGMFVLFICIFLTIVGAGVYILLNAGDIGDFILKLFGRSP